MPRSRESAEVLALSACPRCHTIQATHTPCLCHYRLMPPEGAGLPSVAMAVVLGLSVVIVICGALWGVVALVGR